VSPASGTRANTRFSALPKPHSACSPLLAKRPRESPIRLKPRIGFRVEGYGLLADTGGKGRHRGGLGFYRSYRVLKDGVKFAIYADRFRIPPSGLAGGEDGTTGSCEIQRGDERIQVRSKDSVKLLKGDLLVLKTGGGGGYGQIAERSDAAIARDLSAGFVTA